MSGGTILKLIILFFIGLILYLLFIENGKTCGGLSGNLIERKCFPGLFFCEKISPNLDSEGQCRFIDFNEILPAKDVDQY